jgi:hypothetical protein
VGYPSINLKKRGVSVSFLDWDGSIPAYSEMDEVWVTVEGIPPKHLCWKVIARVATSLGVLLDVGWHTIFRSLYKCVKLKLAVRDPSKIPETRAMEFDTNMFLLTITVHDPENLSEGADGDEPGDDNHGNGKPDDGEQESDGRSKPDGEDKGRGKNMDTDPAVGKTPEPARPPSGGRTSGGANRISNLGGTASKHVEARVMSSVLGTPAIKHKSYVHDRERPPAENISVHLLEQFDEASDSDGDEILVHDGRAAVAAAVEPQAVTEKVEKKKWGPVLATRASNRIKKDGKLAIEKLKKSK